MRFNYAFIFGVAFCASLVSGVGNLYAQDELDGLLSDLEAEEAPAAEAPSAEEKPAVAEAAAEEETVEEVTEDVVADEGAAVESGEEAVEEPADEAAAEEPAEEPAEKADEEPADEEVAEEAAEKPAEEPADDDAAEETASSEEPAPAAEKPVSAVAVESLDDAPLGADIEYAENALPGDASSDRTIKQSSSQTVLASSHPDADLISELTVMEEFRRGALDKQAKLEVAAARDAMVQRQWEEAYEKYKMAHAHLNDRPDTRELRKECRQGMAEARYQQAIQAKREGRYGDAVRVAGEALKLLHPRAAQLIKALEESDEHKREKDVSEVSHVRNEETYHQDRVVIINRLRRAAQLLDVSDLDAALDECDLVLRFDPYNREAFRLRKRIQRRRDLISEKEFESTRRGMIAEVGRAWRPVYAVNSTELTDVDGGTAQTPLGPDPERTKEQEIERRMKEMELPEIAFRPPATIIDVVDYFRQASRDYDKPEVPVDQRGFNFVLQLEKTLTGTASAGASAEDGADDFSASADSEEAGAAAVNSGIPQIPNISASRISMWEALKLVCKISGFKFKVQGSIVMVMPKDMTTDELVTRSYNVLDSFAERASSVSGDMAEMKGGHFGGGDDGEENAEESQQQSWKRLFSTMGVSWPKNSQITYIKTIGKLRVTNTAEQLAILEQALGELNVTPMLIEIETRFVEVAQEDLNSLGFEWLLNSDYSANVGGKLGKWLNLKGGSYVSADGVSTGGTAGGVNPGTSGAGTTTTVNGTWTSSPLSEHNLGVNAFGGTSSYQNGMRYLSTTGNPIAGQGTSVNDSFMRANAFIGNADLSMILHMLSQRTDTDLLSAPKVVTKSGQQAVIKVVTEYIYPQDYDVTISSSSSSSSGVSSGNGSSTILAMVEPQNFTMREVGVILDVTPEVSAEGAMINLELKPQVISEPTWRDYGMKVPIQKQNNSFLSSLELANVTAETLSALQKIMAEQGDQNAQEYYTVPMEQPIFKVRAIDTHVSIYNGATVVMGGLITEDRKSMEDKIPFLGDIPYVGRLFRSRSEWSDKRNLLIFVTARLVDPRGRQMALGSGDDNNERDTTKVTPAPTDK